LLLWLTKEDAGNEKELLVKNNKYLWIRQFELRESYILYIKVKGAKVKECKNPSQTGIWEGL
jgi:hypothetical protein